MAVRSSQLAQDRASYAWEGSPWVDDTGNLRDPFDDLEILVAFLYLRDAEIGLKIDVTLGLNHGNNACCATTFSDILAFVCSIEASLAFGRKCVANPACLGRTDNCTPAQLTTLSFDALFLLLINPVRRLSSKNDKTAHILR